MVKYGSGYWLERGSYFERGLAPPLAAHSPFGVGVKLRDKPGMSRGRRGWEKITHEGGGGLDSRFRGNDGKKIRECQKECRNERKSEGTTQPVPDILR
jgi:hypothetical protein